MLNRSASLAMSTSILKALPGKLDIKYQKDTHLVFSISNPYCTDLYGEIHQNTKGFKLTTICKLHLDFHKFPCWVSFQIL